VTALPLQDVALPFRSWVELLIQNLGWPTTVGHHEGCCCVFWSGKVTSVAPLKLAPPSGGGETTETKMPGVSTIETGSCHTGGASLIHLNLHKAQFTFS